MPTSPGWSMSNGGRTVRSRHPSDEAISVATPEFPTSEQHVQVVRTGVANDPSAFTVSRCAAESGNGRATDAVDKSDNRELARPRLIERRCYGMRMDTLRLTIHLHPSS